MRRSAASSTIEEGVYSPECRSSHEDERKSIDEDEDAVAARQDEEKPVNSEPPQSQYGEHPDGGFRAWLVVTGCAAGACATFGFVNAWGVFQAYYEEQILSGTAPSTISWIGSVQYALIFLPGLIVGRIFDMGWTKVPLAVASAVLIAATFLTAECTRYWQFLLCQGIAVGLACGVIFGLVMGSPAHWFKRRIGLALSVMAIGSSVGGTCFPIAVRNLIQQVGFKWTMRTLGFIELALLVFTILTVKRRLPPRKRTGPFIDLTAFKSPAYSLYCVASFVAFLGMYTVLTYIDVSASASGIDPNFSFYLLAIANGCSMFGRLSGGLLSDRYGPLNVMTPVTAVAGILTYVWPTAKSVAAYVVIAVLYGAASGVYVSLLPAPTVRMGKTHDVGTRVGMSMTIIALGAVAGPPISGAINDSTGGFKYTGIYAGTAILVACCFLLATRFALLGGWRGKC
ncbi:MFS general substrate transporter [Trametes coccinea BRFM310]|uniref:MFS general substrate transporter n=1 Tax=Trametes coccinea (strain BRFM310) TaxID=1353009 RepID=A0A1Y2IJH7_TRAC3|nr:MFS general substrate transporter [Trametes coccinea BRFM310]